MSEQPVPSECRALVAAISQYDGADRIETDSPQQAIAEWLDERGYIKEASHGGWVNWWKVTRRGYDLLATPPEPRATAPDSP